MSSDRRIIYEFGPFRLDSVRRLLARDGEAVPLTPKTFDLLLTLVRNRGQILSKEELLRRIWPGTAVEESNLTQNVFVLRKALGETPGDHLFVVTVPGRGYRFVAPVRESEEGEGAQADWAEAGDGPSRGAMTMAILPFKSIGRQAGEEYWGPGLAGSLINRLNRLRAVVARPITSVLRYADAGRSPQEAGRELGVSAVLDGTVQRAGESIRVNVELVRVGDGVTLWAGQFDDRLTDIFGTQDSISEQVVRALSVELTGEERGRLRRRDTDDGEAYRLYIKGRYFWDQRTRRGLLKGAEYAERALALDPNYVRAWVGVADSYLLLGEYLHLPPAEAFPRAKRAALRALELDDSMAEAHASLAEAFFFYEWDWARAEEEYRRACELNPRYASARHWYAWFLMAQTRFDEALGWLERAHVERAPWMVFLRVEPCFDALRAEPRFRRLVEQLWG